MRNALNKPLLDRARDRLTAQVDGAGLAAFRVGFGLILLWDTWLLIQKAWVERHFFGYLFHFTYWPFDFVKPLPGDGMYVVLLLMGLFGLAVAAGFMYRLTAPALALVVTYIFLVEQAEYLNHWYLVCLLAAVLAIVPAHRCFSVDAWLSRPRPQPTVPAWSWYLLLFQLAVPMTYGGIAKLNADWLRGEPLRMWLSSKADFPLLGPYFQDEPVVYLMAYGALALDLLFVAYICNRRTRVFGFGLLIIFHLLNDRLWSIGIFPWMMIAATPVFFGPDWPRRFLGDLLDAHPWRVPAALLGGLAVGALAAVIPYEVDYVQVAIGFLGGGVFGYFLFEPFETRYQAVTLPRPDRTGPRPLTWGAGLAVAGVSAWVAFQLLFPLRHFTYEGNVHWTDEGHKFAWHMMLRAKSHDSPVFFIVSAAHDEPQLVDPAQHLSPRQIFKMGDRIDMIWQYAQFLESEARREGWGDVAVHVDVSASLNGREMQRLVPLETDLTEVPRPLGGGAEWVTVLEQPFVNTGTLPVNDYEVFILP